MDEEQFNDLLARWTRGDREAEERLYTETYESLRSVARLVLRSQGRGDQLNTTALVNECYLRLAPRAVAAETRGHFMALCARAMRQTIVDSARKALTEKRGGDLVWVTLQDIGGPRAPGPEFIAALGQTLASLDSRDKRLARIAECRIFAGMETAEIAQTFGLTERTVQRDWARVRALLTVALEPEPEP